ncbi:hypothetical protein LguiB_005836 [Lonicera macranthoides]
MEYITRDDDAIENSRSYKEISLGLKTPAKILRYYRDIPPAHNTFKIESFSNLLKSNVPKHQSDKFWANGFNWRVSVYPKGRNNGSEDYVSMYLEIVDTHTLTQNWEVYVNYKLFVYDQLKDKYYTIQDADSKIRRFGSTRTEWGFNKFISFQTLTNASKGYNQDDACVFGAEVFVIKQSGLMEDVTTYTWKVENFSTIKDKECHYSNTFLVHGYSWYLSLFPNGCYEEKNKSLSLYVNADWLQRNPKLRLCAEFKLRIKNQRNDTYHEALIRESWFSTTCKGWGLHAFFPLVDLNDSSKGFMLNDTIILHVENTILSLNKK